MTYAVTNMIGPNLANNDTTQQYRLGTRVKGYDPTLGDGEFIYLKGVASLTRGDAVVYDENFATTRAVAASRGPVAIAMSAAVAGQFGWFQIQGLAVVNVLAAFAADAFVQTSATAGSLDDTITATQFIDGMRSQSAIDTPETGKAYIELAYPCANGR